MSDETVIVYGASDDLVELEGAVREEWSAHDPVLLAMSNGSVWRIAYTDAGIWRITPVILPTGVEYELDVCRDDDDENYSDRLAVVGVTWVAKATEVAR